MLIPPHPLFHQAQGIMSKPLEPEINAFKLDSPPQLDPYFRKKIQALGQEYRQQFEAKRQQHETYSLEQTCKHVKVQHLHFRS